MGARPISATDASGSTGSADGAGRAGTPPLNISGEGGEFLLDVSLAANRANYFFDHPDTANEFFKRLAAIQAVKFIQWHRLDLLQCGGDTLQPGAGFGGDGLQGRVIYHTQHHQWINQGHVHQAILSLGYGHIAG